MEGLQSDTTTEARESLITAWPTTGRPLREESFGSVWTKPGEPGYVVTDVDKVIGGFRDVKGISRGGIMWGPSAEEPKTFGLLRRRLEAAVDCMPMPRRSASAGVGWKRGPLRAAEFKNPRGST